jgi:hypothetical protein
VVFCVVEKQCVVCVCDSVGSSLRTVVVVVVVLFVVVQCEHDYVVWRVGCCCWIEEHKNEIDVSVHLLGDGQIQRTDRPTQRTNEAIR